MKKGIAVPYIIAIFLGVGVIGLLGYWLFVSGIKFGGGVSSEQCRTDFLEACNKWTSAGYNTNIPPPNGVFKNEDNNVCLKQITGSDRALPDEPASKWSFRNWCSTIGSVSTPPAGGGGGGGSAG
ncbi:MAG: hypothetical protein QW818_01465 [Candidatus Aenigmatarchaeota archaeon]|nr:hypothetical protein [Candidatus Aenigmarchaeota archaeon]